MRIRARKRSLEGEPHAKMSCVLQFIKRLGGENTGVVKPMKAATIFLAILAFGSLANACIIYGGGAAYLNSPNVTVNLTAVTANANASSNYTAIPGGVAFKSHYNESLLVTLARDNFSWLVSVGVPPGGNDSGNVTNYSAALTAELDWLWVHGVINGTTGKDVSAIGEIIENNSGSYALWKNGNWTAVANNCYPNGDCVRCGPAGASLNAAVPPYGLDLPSLSIDEQINSCAAGLGLLLLPLFACFIRTERR